MRHDQPTTPFDVEADELTQQFWGSTRGWVSGEQPSVPRRAPRPSRRSDDTTGSLRAIREGFAAFRPQTAPNATGEIRRVRQHGTPSPDPVVAPRREATLGELAAGRTGRGGWLEDEDRDDGWDAGAPDRRLPSTRRAAPGEHFLEAEHDPEYDVPLTPVHPLAQRLGLGAVDPLLLRAGMIVVALVLLVPLMLSLRPSRADSLPGDLVESPQPVVAGAAPSGVAPQPQVTPTAPGTVTAPADTSSTTPTSESSTMATDPSDVTGTTEGAVDEVSSRAAVEAAPTSATAPANEPDDAASVDAAAERIVPACPQTYTAAIGDSWYRIAEAAGVSPNDLLAENNATTETVILPGDDICLPEGASMPTPPEPPTTTQPATTEPPPSTAPPTTTAPTTTVAPAEQLSRDEVRALIRSTWPEDEVETALAVAERESNFVATADNGWCCVGVFQIYWEVHRSWLDDFGITERSDLYDARKNIAAAFHMWQRQGWGPWGG